MIVRAPSWEDVPAVLSLARAADVAVIGDSDWIESDLRAEWKQLDLAHDAWLVELDGALAGYATFSSRGGGRLLGDGYVHPDARGRGVGGELLRLTEERARLELERIDPAERVYLQNATLLTEREDCTPRLYEAHGYAPVRHFWRMVIDLDPAPPLPAAPPAGVELVPYEHPRHARAVHAAQQEAFADHWEHREVPWEQWEHERFGDDRFDPSLWLLAMEGDEIAGFSLNYWKTGGDWGWIGSIGVRRPWRRRGIAEALLRASFAEFARRGETRVGLGVDGQSPTGATRLYERVGMRIFWRAVVYEKELRARG